LENTSNSKGAPYYGSKEWANWILRVCIKELQNSGRPAGSRVCEVLIHLENLKEAGFWWQADRVQNWLNFYWDRLKPPKVQVEDDPDFTSAEGARSLQEGEEAS
jgi:hypothetical protein